MNENNNNLLLSVLIPVYNVEMFLPDCIDSILMQDFDNYEVILINDGSTDSSGDICDKYAVNHTQISVYHQANKGLILTRKELVEKAKGTYCLFIDSDDFIKPAYFSTIATIIQEKSPDVVMIWYEKYLGGVIKSEKEIKFFVENALIEIKDKKKIFKELLGYKYNQIWTKVFRKELYDLSMGNRGELLPTMGEDLYQLIPIFYNAKTFYYLNQPFYCYRVNENSITANIKFSYVTDQIIVLERLFNYFQLLEMNSDSLSRKVFLLFMQRILLRFIYNTSYSKLEFKEKISRIKRLKTLDFYNLAKTNFEFSNLTFFEKNFYILFQLNLYKTLIILSRIVYIIKNRILFKQ